MRISDWSSDVCSSDLQAGVGPPHQLFRIAQNVGEGVDAVVFRFSGRGLVEHREDRVRRLVRRAGSGTIDERQKMLVDEHALRTDARLVGLVQPAREIRWEIDVKLTALAPPDRM